MKFAIYAQVYKPSNNAIVKSLIEAIQNKDGEISFEQSYYNELIKEKIIEPVFETFSNHIDLADDTKFFFFFLGDYTILLFSYFVKSKIFFIFYINSFLFCLIQFFKSSCKGICSLVKVGGFISLT